ncbi:rubrerythrin [Euryarchaeota archaeon ex4484_178]|nr:MAG: rubrerythrin [Euryarchaeota archaeon ex4484_178]
MLSKIPFEMERLEELGKEQPDVELVRIGIIAELDAINLYEQLASLAHNSLVKKVFLDIAQEEKEHFGEFLKLLKELDVEIEDALKHGAEEVDEMGKG